MKAFFKQNAFIRAAVIVLAASLFALMVTACPNAAGGGNMGGGTSSGGEITIPLSQLNIQGTVLKGYTGAKPAGILRVPEDITEIADYAFYECTGITEVHLPENLTKIGESAFSFCFKVSSLDFSKCTKPLTIGNYAFEGCKMTGTVQFPASLASLGKGAFQSCNKVEYFDLRLCNNPPLTAIGTNAFYHTTGRFKVKTGTGVKALLTASGVPAGRIDEAP
ncbi:MULTISPECIES: leucine-rich repeat domain-containing protein [unclassified Treponema]|uniref:leucine-rich repeat domain-containing protein n=1 Tax=unclassified Treponema TaxID=2638727 RepID=UPI0020A5C2F6|nr:MULTISPECIES: leucine-rich repeat domain-containing protein [unclassified Treponema]UTC66046.1 leucine-rich repeat domain-containing protein [Treponema sp. OMZ 789]UTC68776.1 leucine-rich repeat domain-containing protein [Treponema sp. OMZ 790]UTC71505.1 leucine-rich repeat domain-containing protein [Treponema sp. OMZ 791]